MRYPGSKKRIANGILTQVLALRGLRSTYIEPFLGGANSFAVIAPRFRRSYGIEGNLDVALMWQAVKAGWEPPYVVSKDDYLAAQRDPNPSPLRGFLGSGGSFGGKWFAGYAQGGVQSTGEPRNHQAESARAVVAKRSALECASIMFGDYSEAPVTSNCVVYCDPPYAGTLDYSGATVSYNSDEFWNQCERWVDLGALVLVSEYAAPSEWSEVASFDHRMSVSLTADRKATVEKLFVRR